MVTRIYVSHLIKQILTFYDYSSFVFFQFQEIKKIGFYKLFFRFFFFLFLFHYIPRIPTLISPIRTLIPRIPTLISHIPTSIP